MGHERIQDTILKQVISEYKLGIHALPIRKNASDLSRAEQLLATMDAWHDQVTEEDEGKYLNTLDLPGGRITYVFERKSV